MVRFEFSFQAFKHIDIEGFRFYMQLLYMFQGPEKGLNVKDSACLDFAFAKPNLIINTGLLIIL